MAQAACGGPGTASASPSPAATCNPLQVTTERYALDPSNDPTPGFALRPGTEAVGIIADRDRTSVWVLGTGTNRVTHVDASGGATDYALPPSSLGLQLSQGPDGTIWVPEQLRGAVAAIAPDGTARECMLGKDREPYATSVAPDGSVWITEQRGGAIAHLAGDKITEYPLGITNAKGMEVLAARGGGAWFTVDGAPVVGKISDQGAVETIPIGGSGTNIGVFEAGDGAVWVADFGGDRIVRVAPGDHKVTEWKTGPRAKPQSLALGPGDVMWLTESGANRIARIQGATLREIYMTGQWPDHIAITADGYGWFTEYYQDRLGRVKLPR
jgi:streptogramin lyase